MLTAPGSRPAWAWFGRVEARELACSPLLGDLGTGTDALLAELSLPPSGPFDQVVSRDPGSC